MHILADILSLIQYLSLQKYRLDQLRPTHCPSCGIAGVWAHGNYNRKPDRPADANEAGSLNPIFIQRFICPVCNKTFSVLPEVIPPQRWYLWSIQQAALLTVLAGGSVRKAAAATGTARSTVRRWSSWLKERFTVYRNTLVGYITDLGRNDGTHAFWAACFTLMPLSKAMRLCHAAGEAVP